MGYFADILKEEFKEMNVREIYSTRLGKRDIEILEVDVDGEKFLAMFQSEEKKHGLYLWSVILTSANNTRTIQGRDNMNTLKLRIRENIKAIVQGIKKED
jgi:DUF971 family protein